MLLCSFEIAEIMCPSLDGNSDMLCSLKRQTLQGFEDLNLIICHIKGWISVTTHENGKMIKSNGIDNGDGTRTPDGANYAKLIYDL